MEITVPTFLTLGRLAAAVALPVVVVAVSHPEAFWVAAALFAAASATDWLDGHLARRFGQESRLGIVLDPIADKVLVSCALLTIIACMDERVWLLIPASVILAREFLVSGLREHSAESGNLLRSTLPAKCKAALQMAALLLLLVCCALGTEPGNALVVAGISAVWMAAALTALTGADYVLKAIRMMREEEANG